MADDEDQAADVDDGSIEIIRLLKGFLQGSEEAGEALLQLSGKETRGLLLNGFLCDIVELQLSQADNRLCELTCGIIANLALQNSSLEFLASNMDVSKLLLKSVCGTDDPNVITEALRAFSNMAYLSRLNFVGEYLSSLGKFSLLLAENSLSGALVAQLVQLVYYIHVYDNNLRSWYATWNAAAFFQPLFLLGTKGDCATALQEDLLSALKAEKLGDANGLEWLLLCADAATSPSDDETKTEFAHWAELMSADWLLIVCLQLLVANESSGWERGQTPSSITLATSEQFLILSILENLVSYRIDGAASEQKQSAVDFVLRRIPVSGGVCGPSWLLRVMLELFLFAGGVRGAHSLRAGGLQVFVVLGPPPHAVRSVVYLVCVLYGHAQRDDSAPHSNDTCKEPASHISEAVGKVAEILDLEGNLEWVAQVCNAEHGVQDMIVRLNAILTRQPDTGTGNKTERRCLVTSAALSALLSKLHK
jgi:hypothetical protein